MAGKPLPQLVVALDNMTEVQARALASELGAVGVTWFKVGLELFTKAGPAIIHGLRQEKFHVFLDLKLHDIPNTVAKAVASAADLGAELLTVHCSAGPVALKSAAEAAKNSALKVVGVTALTSLSAEDAALISEAWGARAGKDVPRGSIALKLAALGASAGLSGIVCSASDLHGRELFRLPWRDGQPLFVTPGIRGPGAPTHDQKSTATVQQAVVAGSTHLVVGRPITTPAPGGAAQSARAVLEAIQEAHGDATHS